MKIYSKLQKSMAFPVKVGKSVYVDPENNEMKDSIYDEIKGDEAFKEMVEKELFIINGLPVSRKAEKVEKLKATFEAEKATILKDVETAKTKVQEDHDKRVKELEADLLKANSKITTLEENLKKKIAKVNPPPEG